MLLKFAHCTACLLWMFALAFKQKVTLRSIHNLRAMQLSPLLEQNSAMFSKVLSRIIESAEFRCIAWQTQPRIFSFDRVCGRSLFGIMQLDDALATANIDAQRGCFSHDRTGWMMSPITSTGSTLDDAKLTCKGIAAALEIPNGTVVVNNAGAYIPQLASYCLSAINIVQLPLAMNLYVTAPGQSTSAPLHTDKQDLLVFQTEGSKRWRVFAPPEPGNMPLADPYGRGKDNDLLHSAELPLAQPEIDATLMPGMVLYVPAGFPHTTDTLSSTSEPSVHVTLAVDRGLTYAHLRSMALRRAGLEDKLNPLTKLSANKYWALQAALPFGFLGDSNNSDISDSSRHNFVHRLLHLMRAIEPVRWGGVVAGAFVATNGASDADIQLAQQLHLHDVVDQAVLHHHHITKSLSSIYRDVARQFSPRPQIPEPQVLIS